MFISKDTLLLLVNTWEETLSGKYVVSDESIVIESSNRLVGKTSDLLIGFVTKDDGCEDSDCSVYTGGLMSCVGIILVEVVVLDVVVVVLVVVCTLL